MMHRRLASGAKAASAVLALLAVVAIAVRFFACRDGEEIEA